MNSRLIERGFDLASPTAPSHLWNGVALVAVALVAGLCGFWLAHRGARSVAVALFAIGGCIALMSLVWLPWQTRS